MCKINIIEINVNVKINVILCSQTKMIFEEIIENYLKINENNLAIFLGHKDLNFSYILNSTNEILNRIKIYDIEIKQDLENFINTFNKIPYRNFAIFIENIEKIPWVLNYNNYNCIINFFI